ncbi:isochorismate lyase [Pseudomonas synxantha]|uniref:isochorismate lyase n=1 Tax=Pseudomonas synxantha TaxID=47883 RepID=UPI000F561E25|nr:isochorismate lyase [Pseudomonas synxantha]AZE77390.1 Isochorismate pyruvate-lyase [Pseudomonas synxantha]
MSPMKAPEACENLNDIRVGIDFFDRQILESLQKRLRYVKAAAQFKANEQEIPAPERVTAMLEERREWALEAGMEVAFVEKLYQLIIEWNIQQQILHWRTNYLPVPSAGTAS